MPLETKPQSNSLTHDDILDALDAVGRDGHALLVGLAYEHFHSIDHLTYPQVRDHLASPEYPVWLNPHEEEVLRPVLASRAAFIIALWYVIRYEQQRYESARRTMESYTQPKQLQQSVDTPRQSRRTFLKAVAASTAAVLVLPTTKQLDAARDWVQYKAQGDLLEDRLSKKFHIAVRVPLMPESHPIYGKRQDARGTVSVEKVILTPLEHYRARVEALEVVSRELHKYPQTFFKRIHMRALVIGKQFAYDEKKVYSGTYAGEVVGVGVSDHDESARNARDTKISSSVHHEIGHALMYNSITHAQWIAAVYEGRAAYDRLQSAKGIEGYVDEYAKTNADEDMATTYEYCMLHPIFVIDATRRDVHHPVVKKKIETVIAHLEKHFPEMSAAYFRDIVEGQVGPTYWDPTGRGGRRIADNTSKGIVGKALPQPPITFFPPRS